MRLSITFKNSRRHAVITNDNVLHLAELGRSHRCITGCSRVCFYDVGHIRIFLVWRWAVTAGENNLASSDRLQ